MIRSDRTFQKAGRIQTLAFLPFSFTHIFIWLDRWILPEMSGIPEDDTAGSEAEEKDFVVARSRAKF
ncbi:hypothetical protein [Desulfatiglans anilini]|uniref:hypothetical protein n=1 Tax=Desulfatiglans anilini TaxID=90728 RepID=UPI0003F7EF5A|nr:hypothetical protein [Desulfatiglans anilini]